MRSYHFGSLYLMTTKFLLCASLALAAANAQNNLTTTAIQRYFNNIRRNLEGAADVMPADKYGYRLTAGQMTFGEWLNHSTERNYTDCAALRSETPPESSKQVPTLKDKDAIGQALKDSLAYCAVAFEKMDDQKATSSPQMSYAFLHVLVHNNEIYGNIAGYLRSNNIVPPSTAARAGANKK